MRYNEPTCRYTPSVTEPNRSQVHLRFSFFVLNVRGMGEEPHAPPPPTPPNPASARLGLPGQSVPKPIRSARRREVARPKTCRVGDGNPRCREVRLLI